MSQDTRLAQAPSECATFCRICTATRGIPVADKKHRRITRIAGNDLIKLIKPHRLWHDEGARRRDRAMSDPAHFRSKPGGQGVLGS